MVIVKSSTLDSQLPIAIIDGFYPKKEILDTTLNLYRSQFRSGHIDKSWSNNFSRFESLATYMNDFEAKTTGKLKLEQFVIFQNNARAIDDQDNKLNDILDKIDPIEGNLKNLPNLNYCINIIADTKTDNYERLNNYVFSFLASTNFRVAHKNQYKNLDDYLKFTDNVIERIEDNYVNIIRNSLGELIDKDKSLFRGVGIA